MRHFYFHMQGQQFSCIRVLRLREHFLEKLLVLCSILELLSVGQYLPSIKWPVVSETKCSLFKIQEGKSSYPRCC